MMNNCDRIDDYDTRSFNAALRTCGNKPSLKKPEINQALVRNESIRNL